MRLVDDDDSVLDDRTSRILVDSDLEDQVSGLGWAGRDMLIGDAGSNRFVYKSQRGGDRILDYCSH